MSTIRERDEWWLKHEWGRKLTEAGADWFSQQRGVVVLNSADASTRRLIAAEDCHALLAAGDAMAAEIEGEHRQTDWPGRCDSCERPYPCTTRQAADHWREVTDGRA